jgi:hypothetical protein
LVFHSISPIDYDHCIIDWVTSIHSIHSKIFLFMLLDVYEQSFFLLLRLLHCQCSIHKQSCSTLIFFIEVSWKKNRNKVLSTVQLTLAKLVQQMKNIVNWYENRLVHEIQGHRRCFFFKRISWDKYRLCLKSSLIQSKQTKAIQSNC